MLDVLGEQVILLGGAGHQSCLRWKYMSPRVLRTWGPINCPPPALLDRSLGSRAAGISYDAAVAPGALSLKCKYKGMSAGFLLMT